ncbi:MAG: hypothetical protein GY755_17560 [Chloroflexi bacterium]|nr:hypothetical protein [Chloroflexota bacterium]
MKSNYALSHLHKKSPPYLLMPYKGGAYATKSNFVNKIRRKIRTCFFSYPKNIRLAYLHIPKTGGTYIKQSESNNVPVIQPIAYLSHTYITTELGISNPIYTFHDKERERFVFLKNELKNYIIASTVRNIFSWLVSYYWHAGGEVSKYLNFEHYDYDIASKGFDYLVNTIANRNTIWPNKKFIFTQLFSSDGILAIDWINRTETLDQDLKEFATTHEVNFVKQKKQRVGHKTDYRTYYTDSLIDIVNNTWQRELSLFGYNFNGTIASSNVLHKAISRKQKEEIRYFWNEDQFTSTEYL